MIGRRASARVSGEVKGSSSWRMLRPGGWTARHSAEFARHQSCSYVSARSRRAAVSIMPHASTRKFRQATASCKRPTRDARQSAYQQWAGCPTVTSPFTCVHVLCTASIRKANNSAPAQGRLSEGLAANLTIAAGSLHQRCSSSLRCRALCLAPRKTWKPFGKVGVRGWRERRCLFKRGKMLGGVWQEIVKNSFFGPARLRSECDRGERQGITAACSPAQDILRRGFVNRLPPSFRISQQRLQVVPALECGCLCAADVCTYERAGR